MTLKLEADSPEGGDRPSLIASCIRWIGVQPDDFTANLIGSHPHHLAVAVNLASLGAWAASFATVLVGGRDPCAARDWTGRMRITEPCLVEEQKDGQEPLVVPVA